MSPILTHSSTDVEYIEGRDRIVQTEGEGKPLCCLKLKPLTITEGQFEFDCV